MEAAVPMPQSRSTTRLRSPDQPRGSAADGGVDSTPVADGSPSHANSSTSGGAVLAFGDSLTAGCVNGGECYPYTVRLREILGCDRAAVVCSGRGGETTAEMIQRIKTVLESHQSNYFTHVVILGGTNDLRLKVETDTICKQLLVLHDMVRAAGARCIAITIPTVGPQDRGVGRHVGAERDAINTTLRQEACDDRLWLADLDTTLSRLPEQELPSLFSDGTHFSAKGYDLMGEVVHDALERAGFVAPPDSSKRRAASFSLTADFVNHTSEENGVGRSISDPFEGGKWAWRERGQLSGRRDGSVARSQRASLCGNEILDAQALAALVALQSSPPPAPRILLTSHPRSVSPRRSKSVVPARASPAAAVISALTAARIQTSTTTTPFTIATPARPAERRERPSSPARFAQPMHHTAPSPRSGPQRHLIHAARGGSIVCGVSAGVEVVRTANTNIRVGVPEVESAATTTIKTTTTSSAITAPAATSTMLPAHRHMTLPAAPNVGTMPAVKTTLVTAPVAATTIGSKASVFIGGSTVTHPPVAVSTPMQRATSVAFPLSLAGPASPPRLVSSTQHTVHVSCSNVGQADPKATCGKVCVYHEVGAGTSCKVVQRQGQRSVHIHGIRGSGNRTVSSRIVHNSCSSANHGGRGTWHCMAGHPCKVRNVVTSHR
eukprot:TRINITY_DN74823_c0_g1_i1.p1 TRINITY_DN74823_c0_g1~~TRINITY_DN74823_c0_g1_i1.p1  ORF type:complete len:665 (+),score=74.27 TRINITY_DN74823_c0_g1_i1:55-2049(+)